MVKRFEKGESDDSILAHQRTIPALVTPAGTVAPKRATTKTMGSLDGREPAAPPAAPTAVTPPPRRGASRISVRREEEDEEAPVSVERTEHVEVLGSAMNSRVPLVPGARPRRVTGQTGSVGTLSQREAMILRLVNGTRNVQAIVEASGLPAPVAIGALQRLTGLKLIGF
jgi:hypothetical protein